MNQQSHLIRGAWIEILSRWDNLHICLVASHTRCVDWNARSHWFIFKKKTSHLIRGAWIEITSQEVFKYQIKVASHTRCVDWNRLVLWKFPHRLCRISYEVRGLKSWITSPNVWKVWPSHLIRGAWIEISIAHLFSDYSQSHLIRGAWIEIDVFAYRLRSYIGRISYEVRGLK